MYDVRVRCKLHAKIDLQPSKNNYSEIIVLGDCYGLPVNGRR